MLTETKRIHRVITTLDAILALACAVLLGLGMAVVFLRHVGHDQAWCVYAADLVLRGTQLSGPYLVEVNPPFIIWFSCLPVLLSRLLHLDILNGFCVFFDLTALLSLGWTTSLLRRVLRAPVLDLWGFALLQVLIAFWLIGRDSLGQREHFLVLLILPYFVLCAGRLQQTAALGFSEQILVGITASVAVCLKPQHLLSVVLVEAYLLIRKRNLMTWLTPATVAFATGLLAYAAAMAIWGRTYMQTTLPLLRLTYFGLNLPLRMLLASATAKGVMVVLVLGWLALLQFHKRLRYAGLLVVFSLAATGSFAAYLQQHKGWSYQLIPSGMFAFFLLGTFVISLVRSSAADAAPAPRMQGVLVAAAVLACLCSCGYEYRFGKRAGYFEPDKNFLAEVYGTAPAGAAVSFISTQPWEMPVVIEQGKVLGQRLNYFWLLPAIVHSADPGDTLPERLDAHQIQTLSKYQRTTMAEDLAHWKPVLVVVDQCGPDLCAALEREHIPNMLAWFEQDPRFRAEWEHYRPVQIRGELQSYQRVN